jgi:hypothetical protein
MWAKNAAVRGSEPSVVRCLEKYVQGGGPSIIRGTGGTRKTTNVFRTDHILAEIPSYHVPKAG